MRKCKYYNQYTWVEPPSEPGENGTPYTEYECKNASGTFIATCEGKKKLCNLEEAL